MIGRTISHYEILEKLGAGGMGEIYKARDPRLNRTVAIKALPDASAGDPDRRRRFIQEAQSASGLNHPNIITIHDILSDGGADYMVMELVTGKTLGDLIPKGGMGVAKTLQCATQIADALSAAHAAGIVHRDLKPGNVMVTDSGRVKVLDFGLAKVTMAASLTEDTQTLGGAPMTVEGSILGTVSYMSPEQAQGKRVDSRSDIFAFGALLYEMTTGQKAFGGDSAIVTLTAILRDEVKPVSDFAAGVPPELEEVVGRCLRKNPEQRWRSMQEVYGVLAALRQKFESGILDVTQALPPAAPKSKKPALILALVTFLIVTTFGGWYAALHRRGAAPTPQAPQAAAQVTAQPSDAKPSPTAPLPSPVTPKKEDAAAVTNDSVLEMLQAKVAEPVILSHINSAAKTAFNLSTPEIIRLTRAGVSPEILEAMRHPGSSPAATPGAAPPAAVPVEARSIKLLQNLPMNIALLADVPNDPEPATPLRFQVKDPFGVDGVTVIAAGAVVTGEVAGVKKSILGGSKPTFRLISVNAVDGTKIKLRAAPGKPGEKAEHVIEPAGRRDKSLLAPAGSPYLAYIDGEQTVQVKK